jgi:hypothetical protein
MLTSGRKSMAYKASLTVGVSMNISQDMRRQIDEVADLCELGIGETVRRAVEIGRGKAIRRGRLNDDKELVSSISFMIEPEVIEKIMKDFREEFPEIGYRDRGRVFRTCLSEGLPWVGK